MNTRARVAAWLANWDYRDEGRYATYEDAADELIAVVFSGDAA